jgi:glycolate oxidase
MHTKIMMDVSKKEQWEGAQRAIKEIYEYVNSIHGTTSAEHGIGISKADAFRTEKMDSLKMMAAVKAALDPNNILNPGKLQQAPENWVTATDLRYAVNS